MTKNIFVPTNNRFYRFSFMNARDGEDQTIAKDC